MAEEVVVEDVWITVLVFVEALGDAGRTQGIGRDDRGLEVEERRWDLNLKVGAIGLLMDGESAILGGGTAFGLMDVGWSAVEVGVASDVDGLSLAATDEDVVVEAVVATIDDGAASSAECGKW